MNRAYNFLVNDLGIMDGDSIVVACSGGPDSMALLSLILNVKKCFNINIIVAHVNHNVRIESDDEKLFVENFCIKNNVIFEYMKIDFYNDDNFESEARFRRYNFFSQIVKKYNSKYLMTAHHGDDLMETVLMRIVRGSSLKGYSGFSEIVFKDNYKIVRPLIHLTKQEILDFNEKNDIKYVIDKSNFTDEHTRNRYRKYVLPVLKNENPCVHDKFYKFSNLLCLYDDYVDKQAKLIFSDVYVNNELLIDKFLLLDKIICIKIIYFILEELFKENLVNITDKHVDLILDLINSSKSNSGICLPNNVRVVKSYNVLHFFSDFNNFDGYEYKFNEFVCLPNGKSIQMVKKTSLNDNNVIRLNSADIVLPLYVRTRKSGDKIFIKGMNGSRKIKDIFIDSKIPKYDRDLWPIVVDSNDSIVWIPGIKKSKFDKIKGENCDIILRYC